MASDKVGMEVSEEDVTNLETELAGVVEILLDIALRVDDDGGVGGFVAEEVGGMREAAEIVLLEDHGALKRIVLACGIYEGEIGAECYGRRSALSQRK